jgi:hypothetical protein
VSKPGGFILANICFKAQGDVGPLTCYTNKERIVMFLKAWLRDPASQRQIAHRDRIREAARIWKLLCPGSRKRWEYASKKASTRINGYNMFVHWIMTGVDSQIEAVELQSGHQLLPLCFADDTCCSAAYNDVIY